MSALARFDRAHIENGMLGAGLLSVLVGITLIVTGANIDDPQWHDNLVYGGLASVGVGTLLVLFAPSAEDDI